MKNRAINPAFFQKGDPSAFNNVQQSKGNIKLKYKNARKQGTLNLSSCQPPLAEIPVEVLSLDSFLEADEKFWEIEPLRVVDFSFNAIQSIPDEICNLTDCHTMKMRNNQISALPEALCGCQGIRVLDMGNNSLTSISEAIHTMRDLKELSLNNNQLSLLPNGLFACAGLQKLELQDNRLQAFGPARQQLYFPNMLSLNLSNNHLQSLPDLSSLSMLEALHCQHNQLTAFPSLQALGNLKYLDASQNKLTAFPILPTGKLAQCVLSFNHIACLPEEVCVSQRALVELLIHNNSLTALPKEIEYMACLKLLDVSNNNLSDLPAGLGFMTALQILKTEGNAIRTIRQTILVKNAQEIKAYLRTRGVSLLAGAGGEVGSVSAKGRAMGGQPAAAMRNASSVYSSEQFDELQHRIRTMTAGTADLSKIRIDCLDGDVAENLQIMINNGNALHTLDISQNNFTAIPVEVLGMFGIKKCNMSHNKLSLGNQLMPNLSNTLAVLDVSHNNLSSAQLGSILQYSSLVELIASHNPLRTLPDALRRCSSMKKVCLAYCQLTDVSAMDFRMLSLETVDLSNNRIASLSNNLHCADHLATLNIENNDLRDIPLALGKLDRLQTLLLAGNPQKMIRSQIVQQGSSAILQAMRDKAMDYQMPDDRGSAGSLQTPALPNPPASGASRTALGAARPSIPAFDSRAMSNGSAARSVGGYSRPAGGYDREDNNAAMVVSRPAPASTAMPSRQQQPVSLGQSLARRRDEEGGADDGSRARRAEALSRLNRKTGGF